MNSKSESIIELLKRRSNSFPIFLSNLSSLSKLTLPKFIAWSIPNSFNSTPFQPPHNLAELSNVVPCTKYFILI